MLFKRPSMSLRCWICMACLLRSALAAGDAGEARRRRTGPQFQLTPITKTIDTIQQDIVKTQEITREFLELARGVQIEGIDKAMLKSIDYLDKTIHELQEGTGGYIAPPSKKIQEEWDYLEGIWTTYKGVLRNNYETVNADSTEILYEVHLESKYISQKMEALLQRYIGDAELLGVTLRPLDQQFARTQLANIEYMMKDGLFENLHIAENYYDEQLIFYENLFAETQISLVNGDKVVGLDPLKKVCTLHEMLAVDGYWVSFLELIKKFHRKEALDQTFFKDLEGNRTLLAGAMQGSVELFEYDDGNCHIEETIDDDAWYNVLMEANKVRMLSERSCRLWYELAMNVHVDTHKANLVLTLDETTETLRKCRFGSQTDNIPAPPTQAIKDYLTAAETDWQLLQKEMKRTSDADLFGPAEITSVAEKSAVVLYDIDVAVQGYVESVHLVKPHLRTIVWTISSRQLTLIEEMAVEGLLIALGDYGLTVSDLEHAFEVFQMSHWELLVGRDPCVDIDLTSYFGDSQDHGSGSGASSAGGSAAGASAAAGSAGADSGGSSRLRRVRRLGSGAAVAKECDASKQRTYYADSSGSGSGAPARRRRSNAGGSGSAADAGGSGSAVDAGGSGSAASAAGSGSAADTAGSGSGAGSASASPARRRRSLDAGGSGSAADAGGSGSAMDAGGSGSSAADVAGSGSAAGSSSATPARRRRSSDAGGSASAAGSASASPARRRRSSDAGGSGSAAGSASATPARRRRSSEVGGSTSAAGSDSAAPARRRRSGGRLLSDSNPRALASTSGDASAAVHKLEGQLFLDLIDYVPRTTDACKLTEMANVLQQFDLLKENLMKVVVNDPVALDGLDYVVAKITQSMEKADGFYRQGKGDCHAKLSTEAFEYALYTLGPLPYLLQKAMSEYYNLAFRETEQWRKTSMKIEHEQEAFVADDAVNSTLQDAFVSFKNAWDAYRNTEEETSLGLQVEYISQNPYPEGEKKLLDRAEASDAYHVIHGHFHPIYRAHMEDRNYVDLFLLDLSGNLIYSVDKLSDFATNFHHEGNGRWKDEGLGIAFKQAVANPNKVQVIPWKPYGPVYPTYASFLSITIPDNETGDSIGVFATRVPVEAQTHDSVARLLEAERDSQKILQNFIYGDLEHLDSETQKVEPIYPPPDQQNADALFALNDVLMPLIPIFEQTEGQTNDEDAYYLATKDKELFAATDAVLQSYVDVAWLDAPAVHGTRILIAFQQLGIIQSIAKKATLFEKDPVKYNVSSADITAAMNQFLQNHQVLTTGQAGTDHSRRLASQPVEETTNTGAGEGEAKGTTYKDEVVVATHTVLQPLLAGVERSWTSLKPILDTVVQIDKTGDVYQRLYQVTMRSYDLIKAQRKVADWYSSTTRTTTLATLKILSTLPLTGEWAAGKTMQVAALVTESLINDQQELLPGYNLRSKFLDDKCDGTSSRQTVLQEQATDDTYIALAGSGCDGVCKETSFVASSIRLPYVSYECADRELSDATQYPQFLRFGTVTVPYAFDVIRDLARNFSWNEVTLISGDPSRYRTECEYYQSLFGERGIRTNYVSAYDREWGEIQSMMAKERQISKDKYRVYFFVGTEMMFRRVLCASILSGARRGITWLSQGTRREGWWGKTDMVSEFMDEWMTLDYESDSLKDSFVYFKDAWDSYTSSETTETALRAVYVTEQKEMFDGPANGNQSYDTVHIDKHPEYRAKTRDHDLFDTFFIDLEGNVIYSVMKEPDFATNLKTGEWKDSGLAQAFEYTQKDPHHVAHIDWSPYGPLGGAQAAFLSIGIMNKSNNDHLLGVYATMLPTSYQKPVEEIAPECSFEELTKSYMGGINIVGLGRPQEENMEKPLGCFSGFSSRSFRTLLANHLEKGFPEGDTHTMVKDPYNDLKAHAVDAVCAIAMTINFLHYEEGHPIEDIQKPNAELYEKFMTHLKEETKFEGASGHVEFKGNDRPNYLAIQQLQTGSNKYTEVGFVSPEGRIWTQKGGASNASWTKEFPDPPEPEPYFPWFLFQIVAPILIVTCPMCLACYKVLLNKGDSAGFEGK